MKTIALMLGLLVLAESARVRAEVLALEIQQREPFAGGKSFGAAGPYEKIVGIARFAIDPEHARNRGIVDLSLARKNDQGKVEFAADFYLLAPKDPAKGNGAIFYDVNNRGNKLALRMFNFAPGGNDLDKPGSEGDGFLFRRGYAVLWCGWIGEMLPGEGRLLLQAPRVEKPVTGKVRFEMSTDAPAESLPLSRREGHGCYVPMPSKLKEATLTWRMREGDPRVPIPVAQWSLEVRKIPEVQHGVPGTLPQVRLKLSGGFRPGYLYELIAECDGPIVQGTGFAAVRDLVSFLRHDDSERNPLRDAAGKPAVARALAFGVSQSGRFLRNLLYLDFNTDEAGRIVFDGLMPHVAGGGLGFFNHRFAQPTRFAGQNEDHLYPVDYFPFTYGPATDPFSKRTDSILRSEGSRKARIMHTQSAAEYWHRSGSLVHTDPLGTKDADIPANVRIYAFGGTQHGPAAYPPGKGIADNLNNPGDYRPMLRALLDGLDRWVKDGKTPPASVYPRIDNKTLVDWRQKSTGFPAIPGVRYPEVIQQPPALDYGPRFLKEGVITQEPPRMLGQYIVLGPRSDRDGNDLGTLLPPEVAVPTATYTGWNLRRRDVGGEGMLANLLGSYIPFAKTKDEATAAGDTRLSIEERYPNGSYRKLFGMNCFTMMEKGYLLEEDTKRLIKLRDR
ncbi:MAG: hypothetical protein FJ271_01790 [Planctomycetes bacterium]|nr:hypothetical protein [Planctomycetota bacterium]